MKFLILAVSYKPGGLCVAGLNLDSLEYVRIGYSKGDECAAIPAWKFRRQTVDGEIQLNVLDVIDIDVVKMAHNGCQTENYYLKNINNYDGTFTIADIDAIYRKLEKKTCIFLNNSDYVDIEHINNLDCSLQFVKVENFTVTQYSNINDNQRLRAAFNYNGMKYDNIRVTDSVFRAYPSCYGDAQKVCSRQNAYIMVSLPYNGWSIDFGKFYKCVSGIIII